MTINFHENALKQFSRQLKFTNLASEPQKILTYLFMFPECIIQVIHHDFFMDYFTLQEYMQCSL